MTNGTTIITTTTTTTTFQAEPTSVFVEQFGNSCQNLCETAETGEAAMAVARNYTRGGKIIHIRGKFLKEMDKVVGIRRFDGETIYKNSEGYYHVDEIEEFAKKKMDDSAWDLGVK